MLSILDEEEKRQWHAAKARALEEGSLLWARPLHCAAGSKPD